MKRKHRRVPVCSTVLLIATIVFAVRSVRHRDTLAWRTLDDERSSVTDSKLGLETARLGLRVFYEQNLVTAANPRSMNKLLDTIPPAGWHVSSTKLPPEPSARSWLGLGFERAVDERPESFRNVASVTVPLWLLAALCAIGPVRFALARRAARRAREESEEGVKGVRMKLGTVIALFVGLGIGAVVAFFVLRLAGNGGAGANASAQAEAEQPPIHPVVGTWRTKIAPLVLTYTFGNDGKFALSVRGVPAAGGRGVTEHGAGGTWKVDGDTLVMRNTTSGSPLTVVGEEESARILSLTPDALVLENVDRKGRPERVEFERVRPFVRGKFDNPALLGEWRSEQNSLELTDSGDATWTSRPDVKHTYAHSGQWSQTGSELRLVLDRVREQVAGRPGGDAERKYTEPAERVYEIIPARDKNMLLLRPLKPEAGAHVTFYRVN